MKIYLVTSQGDYDEPATVWGTYSTRELAEEGRRRYGEDKEIQEQEIDQLPELPDEGYAWEVSCSTDGLLTPRYANVELTKPTRSWASARSGGGVVCCFARNQIEAVAIAQAEFPRLRKEAEQQLLQEAVRLQAAIDAGRIQIVGVTKEMLINDQLGAFVELMPRSRTGK